MKLREYRREDAAVIAGWIRDEAALYRWSADRICRFPLRGEDLNGYYEPLLPSGAVIPLTMADGEDRAAGHLFIRYPDESDRSTVRFGFVIVDPLLRGRGQGKAMLKMAAVFARDTLKATRVTLGVFTNNPDALHCYEAAGFRSTGETARCVLPVGEWECTEMAMTLSSR